MQNVTRNRFFSQGEEAQCSREGTTIIMGDLTKGGRYPTPEEEERLAGTHAAACPKGSGPVCAAGNGGGSVSTRFSAKLSSESLRGGI